MEVQSKVWEQQVSIHLVVKLLLEVGVELIFGLSIVLVQGCQEGKLKTPFNVLLLEFKGLASLFDLLGL